MSRRVFFVTGLPRSRTAWLANFLTVPPMSLCWHDGLSRFQTPARLVEAIEVALTQYEYVGVSDSGIPWVWRRLMDAYPQATWILVDRKTEAVAQSLDDVGLSDILGITGEAIAGTARDVLDLAIGELNGKTAHGYTVRFEDLSDPATMFGLADTIYGPGDVANDVASRERVEMLESLNVQTKVPTSIGVKT